MIPSYRPVLGTRSVQVRHGSSEIRGPKMPQNLQHHACCQIPLPSTFRMGDNVPAPSSESWKDAKTRGNQSYAAGDIDAAIAHYTEALRSEELLSADRALILCNRAQVCASALAPRFLWSHDCTLCPPPLPAAHSREVLLETGRQCPCRRRLHSLLDTHARQCEGPVSEVCHSWC